MKSAEEVAQDFFLVAQRRISAVLFKKYMTKHIDAFVDKRLEEAAKIAERTKATESDWGRLQDVIGEAIRALKSVK